MSTDIKCWICGKTADSAEHQIKATDMRAAFPNVDQQNNPLYLQKFGSLKKPMLVGSIKRNDHLKYSKSLCTTCNTTLTQDHDLCYEWFSKYLRNISPIPKKGGTVRGNRIFRGYTKRKIQITTRDCLLAVHLFFLKQLGCNIIENSYNINVSELANAIKKSIAHPNVFLSINYVPTVIRQNALLAPSSAFGEYQRKKLGHLHYNAGRCNFGTLDVLINIAYVEGAIRPGQYFWHPSDYSTKLVCGEHSGMT